MVRQDNYVDLKGRVYPLSRLDADERKLLREFEKRYKTNLDCNEFDNYWTSAVAALYDARGMSRSRSRETALYKIAQDMGSRLAVDQGLARVPDYRDELEQIIRTRFGTRREFCQATGMTETMLSHVLGHRKHVAIKTLESALSRIGYAIRLTPQNGESAHRSVRRR